MNIHKRKFGLFSAGLVIAISIVLLGVVVTSAAWYPTLVMATAAVWFALIAFRDRPLTAEEKRIRADRRRE